MSTSIVWFRHALRMQDNPALQAAIALGQPIICLYIDDPTSTERPLGSASQWWLHQSLTQLSASIKKRGNQLIISKSATKDTFDTLIAKHNVSHVFWDTPPLASLAPEQSTIAKHLASQDITIEQFNASLLYDHKGVLNKQGAQYKVFTAFWKVLFFERQPNHLLISKAPEKIPKPKNLPDSIALDDLNLIPDHPWHKKLTPYWTPGEKGALKQLRVFLDDGLDGYGTLRDRPDMTHTSKLSAHLQFGEISPVRVWRIIEENNTLPQKDKEVFLKQLIWREFSYNLLMHTPTMVTQNWKSQFDKFKWDDNETNFKLWQKGLTGYPIVDAGMRQLWETGWMHNRVRMIVGSFLIKDLLIDWRKGEQWFWDTLVDADIGNNVAGWQWVAGCGADAAPYFRIFNPVLQSQKFDPNGSYIRKWVPELAKLPTNKIHAPWEATDAELAKADLTLGKTYPKPMIDHGFARDRAMERYRQLKAD